VTVRERWLEWFVNPHVNPKSETPALRTGVLIGFMGSGKTVTGRWLAMHVEREHPGETIYIEAPSLAIARRLWQEGYPGLPEETRRRVRRVFIFVDDAILYAHSRSKNVEETQLFATVRHWANPGRGGIVYVLYATQDFKLLDRLMRGSMMYVWKTLPFQWYVGSRQDRAEIARWVGDPEALDLLQEFTRYIYETSSISDQAKRTAIIRVPVLRSKPWITNRVRLIGPDELPDGWIARLGDESFVGVPVNGRLVGDTVLGPYEHGSASKWCLDSIKRLLVAVGGCHHYRLGLSNGYITLYNDNSVRPFQLVRLSKLGVSRDLFEAWLREVWREYCYRLDDPSARITLTRGGTIPCG